MTRESLFLGEVCVGFLLLLWLVVTGMAAIKYLTRRDRL